MSDNKPTHGPWIHEYRHGPGAHYVCSAENLIVASCGKNASMDSEIAANARLIAAAPELLAVLSECAKQLSAMGATAHATRAREAIARATA